MQFIIIGLFLLALYYFWGFLVASASAVFFTIVLVMMVIRAIITYPQRKRDAAEKAKNEKHRNAVFGRLHYRVAMAKTLKEDHPEDWELRLAKWETEDMDKELGPAPKP